MIWQSCFYGHADTEAFGFCCQRRTQQVENFIFTEADRNRFDAIYDNAIREATMFIDKAKFDAERRAEDYSEFYNLADYDEVFTVEFAEEIYSSLIEKNMDSIFQMFLSDEIFVDKKKGE